MDCTCRSGPGDPRCPIHGIERDRPEPTDPEFEADRSEHLMYRDQYRSER